MLSRLIMVAHYLLFVAALLGIEPRSLRSERSVLPLHHGAFGDPAQSRSQMVQSHQCYRCTTGPCALAAI